MKLRPRGWLLATSVGILVVGAFTADAVVPPIRYVHYNEARSVINELAAALPSELRSRSEVQREAEWSTWIARRDREIRARLARGDEDTVVNWLLFGTSFTSQPRARLSSVAADTRDENQALQWTATFVGRRLDDLLRALTEPGTDERRLFARGLLEQKGFTFDTNSDREAAGRYLLTAVTRVAREQQQIDRDLDATRQDDPTSKFVVRSRLFRSRGLSLDTSLFANYAVEDSLAAMKARGLLKQGGVKRVAIIGPGLDFTDKNAGFDFYPQQTLQPFAVLDSLRRLNLTPPLESTDIVLFDISPRLLDHVAHARVLAANGTGYTLYLPLARGIEWLPGVRKYWGAFGDRIGGPATLRVSASIAAQADLRAARATAAAVQRISAADLNIVTERLDGDPFDLMIATNVFVYYDVLDQALAMANVDAMLKSGGFLLANFAAPELTALDIRWLDSLQTVYAHTDNLDYIFDYMVWYEAHHGSRTRVGPGNR
jgi:hypothetical protein